jgi:hypothetical protein
VGGWWLARAGAAPPLPSLLLALVSTTCAALEALHSAMLALALLRWACGAPAACVAATCVLAAPAVKQTMYPFREKPGALPVDLGAKNFR